MALPCPGDSACRRPSRAPRAAAATSAVLPAAASSKSAGETRRRHRCASSPSRRRSSRGADERRVAVAHLQRRGALIERALERRRRVAAQAARGVLGAHVGAHRRALAGTGDERRVARGDPDRCRRAARRRARRSPPLAAPARCGSCPGRPAREGRQQRRAALAQGDPAPVDGHDEPAGDLPAGALQDLRARLAGAPGRSGSRRCRGCSAAGRASSVTADLGEVVDGEVAQRMRVRGRRPPARMRSPRRPATATKRVMRGSRNARRARGAQTTEKRGLPRSARRR